MPWTYEYSKCLKDRTEEMPVGEKADLFDRIGEILTAYRMMTAEAAAWKNWAYQEKKSMDCWIFPLQSIREYRSRQ